MIKCEGLTKTFRTYQKEPGLKGSIKALFNRKWEDKTAVKDVSFEISPGEIVGMVGANGAGKTTLVKMLSGIVHPTSGSAKVLGHTPWERSNDMRSKIAVIMGQKASLWWDLPAFDCYLLLKDIYQIADQDFNTRLEDLASKLDVTHLLKVQIRKLSLGERMKMELIAALLHRPEVIFLDEPTIGLDITSQKTIRKFLKDYQQEYSPSMILTSHYMEDIAALCKRIMIVRKGELVYNGGLTSALDKFARKKIIAINLVNDNENICEIPNEFGEILSCEGTKLKVHTPKESVPKALNYLLEKYAVADVEIHQADMADIIEKMMNEGVTL